MTRPIAPWMSLAVVLTTGFSVAASGTRYAVTNLPSLGGTNSSGNSLNDRSWASGTSNMPGDSTQHAALWIDGVIVDLGTLGGPNSGVIWPVKNNVGLVSGIAETNTAQPLGENWSCLAFFPTRSGNTCRGVAWDRGQIRALPTLGGDNGFATGSNNQRVIAGWTETAVRDSTCVAPQVLQFLPVLWGPGADQIQALPTLPGDSTGAATALNDGGQVVGISGRCDRAVGRFSAAHAVLWQNGAVVDIGNLGGVAWNTPMAINESGQVTGFSNVSASSGGHFNAHAFLWTSAGGIRDLGTLPGDAYSEGLGINDAGQIVGLSCSAGFATCRGFVWQNGSMTDLNSLVAPGYGDSIVAAGDIDNAGRITGQSFDPLTNVFSAFLASPQGGSGDSALASPVRLPAEVRKILLRQSGIAEEDL